MRTFYDSPVGRREIDELNYHHRVREYDGRLRWHPRLPAWDAADVDVLFDNPRLLAPREALASWLALRSGRQPLTHDAEPYRHALQQLLRARGLQLGGYVLLEGCNDCGAIDFLVSAHAKRWCTCGATWTAGSFSRDRMVVPVARALTSAGH